MKGLDLISLISERATALPNHPVYSFLDRNLEVTSTLTYGDLFKEAKIVASLLQTRGLIGKPIALLYPHGHHFIVAFFGAILAGSYPMALTKPRGTDWRGVLDVIRNSGADTILTTNKSSRLFPTQLSEQKGLEIICTDIIYSQENWRAPQICPSDIAFIQYTSGTTSSPKGIEITHQNILANSAAISAGFKCTKLDIVITWLPFHHDMGLIGHVIQPLYSCMHNYFISPADFVVRPIRWLQAISKYQGTISGGPNFSYEMCYDSTPISELKKMDLSSWRIAYSGSEKISESSMLKFFSRFQESGFNKSAFYPCYGMAESTLFVCGRNGLKVSSPNDSNDKYVSVGSILKTSSDIKIVDPISRHENPSGVPGEIWIRSKSVASGYYKNLKLSSLAFNLKLDNVTGYYNTGDVGFILHNELFIIGRSANVIKKRGVKYYSEDIERCAMDLSSTLDFSRCAAFQLASGNIILLLEKIDISNTSSFTEDLSNLSSLICEKIGIILDEIHFVPKNYLTLTTSGKLQREICKTKFLKDQKTVFMQKSN